MSCETGECVLITQWEEGLDASRLVPECMGTCRDWSGGVCFRSKLFSFQPVNRFEIQYLQLDLSGPNKFLARILPTSSLLHSVPLVFGRSPLRDPYLSDCGSFPSTFGWASMKHSQPSLQSVEKDWAQGAIKWVGTDMVAQARHLFKQPASCGSHRSLSKQTCSTNSTSPVKKCSFTYYTIRYLRTLSVIQVIQVAYLCLFKWQVSNWETL